MTDPSTSGPKQTPEQIEADIARQRDELADTVAALEAKLDVKSRAQDKLAELKDRATTEKGWPRPELSAAAAVAVAALAGLVVWRRRRR